VDGTTNESTAGDGDVDVDVYVDGTTNKLTAGRDVDVDERITEERTERRTA